jgi:hypothetical protein
MIYGRNLGGEWVRDLFCELGFPLWLCVVCVCAQPAQLGACDMTALFQAVHIISLGTLHWHARLDPARWEKIHTTHSWYYPPNTRSLATSTPPKALDRRLITFPGGSLLPPSVASHASGTTGAGESSIRTRPSLLSLSSLSVGGVPWVPFRRVTTLESLNGSGWASTISILLFLPICATIESAFFLDLPFHIIRFGPHTLLSSPH